MKIVCAAALLLLALHPVISQAAPEPLNAGDLLDITESEEVMVPGYKYPYRWNNGMTGDAVHFKEVWGYMIAGYVSEYNTESDLTDIGLFAASVDTFGNVVNIPSRSLVADFPGRVHLVAVCDGRALSHFVLAASSLRKKAVRTLAAAAEDFDGVQLDFEYIPPEDSDNYLSFLKYLKSKIGKKQLTVCVHARTKKLERDAEDYAAIGKVADRIMIMAYDEHWSTSAPGSIASMDWCRRVADYALTVWPPEKYIMGAPFYGRTWPDKNWRQAWYFEGINRILHEQNVAHIERENEVPHFTFTTEVTITGWYEDAKSLTARARMYKDYGFSSVAFWRIGHEDDAVWQWIKAEE